MLFVITFLFLMGLIWGSFLNVVIYRTSHGSSPLSGRSVCPKCKHLIPWKYNIPLLSYLILKGRCAYCHKSISVRYPLIESLTGIFFVWWFVVGFNFFRLVGSPWVVVQPLFWLVVGMILIAIFLVDLMYMVIPFSLNLFLFTLAFFYRIFLVGFGIMTVRDFILSIIVGLSLCVLFMMMQVFAKVYKGKDGVGLGDMFLAPSLGLLLGWPKILPAIFAAFFGGSMVGILLILLNKKKLGQYLPFGPFLILGTLIGLVWGNQIFSWYISLLV